MTGWLLAGAERPALHLLLDKDALHHAEGARDRLAVEIERWRPLSLSVASD